jgi:hypothetical protein
MPFSLDVGKKDREAERDKGRGRCVKLFFLWYRMWIFRSDRIPRKLEGNISSSPRIATRLRGFF